jgi:hypothetical protein
MSRFGKTVIFDPTVTAALAGCADKETGATNAAVTSEPAANDRIAAERLDFRTIASGPRASGLPRLCMPKLTIIPP